MSALGLAAVQSRVRELAAMTAAVRRPTGDFGAALAAKQTDALSAATQPRSPVDTPIESSAPTDPSPAVSLDRPVRFSGSATATLGSMLGDAPVATTGHLPDTTLPTKAARWSFAIEAAAHRAGLDPRLLAAVTWAESGFNEDAVSHAGAIGLTQLMPATAAGLGVDPHDPIENLEGGARYLAWTIEEFGSVELGLAAYNAGPGAVRGAEGIPDIAETQAYVPKVLTYFRLLGGTT